jgi:hypothetical protein
MSKIAGDVTVQEDMFFPWSMMNGRYPFPNIDVNLIELIRKCAVLIAKPSPSLLDVF